jgi:thiamine-monophosphate kinase
MLPEDELVGLLAQVAGTSSEVLVGIGDDAAVLDGGLVVCTDALVDGVHFRSDAMSARDIGLRAAAANLSDLAAMGARPLALLAALGLPDGYEDAQELAAGIAGHGVPLAGGDLTRSPVLTVTVTALGRAARPVLRSGGGPGDRLVVSGPLGGQAASGYTLPVTPRLAEGAQLAMIAHAMIDLSDGLASDVRRLASASGTGAVVDLARLPLAPGATVEQAAAGGEDYELLAAVPADAVLPTWATDIGELTERPEVLLVDADGTARDLVGYDHFRR